MEIRFALVSTALSHAPVSASLQSKSYLLVMCRLGMALLLAACSPAELMTPCSGLHIMQYILT